MSTALDMRDAIELCAIDLEVKRSTADPTVSAEGLLVPGAVTTITIKGMIHPAPKEVIERLPEGQRTRDPKQVFTTAELYTARSDRRADVIVDPFGGLEYEVSELAAWSMGQYYEAVALRVDR